MERHQQYTTDKNQEHPVPTPCTLTEPTPSPTADFTCLRLQLQQVGPHVPSRLSVISNLSIGMKTKHFRCVGQWEGLNGFYNQNREYTVTPPSISESPPPQHPQIGKTNFHCLRGDMFLNTNSIPPHPNTAVCLSFMKMAQWASLPGRNLTYLSSF